MNIREDRVDDFNAILFQDFETLDAFGPVEVLGSIDSLGIKKIRMNFYSEHGGIVKSHQGVKVLTERLSDLVHPDILLIPGGMGVRTEIDNIEFIRALAELCDNSRYVLTVCTGTALLAKTGLLKGIKATSNKSVFDWVSQQDKEVLWQKKARWVKDEKYYTSSGISAGIDMTLDFVKDLYGVETAESIATHMEYLWNRISDHDPFAPK